MSSTVPATERSHGTTALLTTALPFVLAAALYLSVVFAAVAALPLVFAYLRFGRALGVLCCVCNTALVWLTAGQFHAATFFVLAVVTGTALTEGVRLRWQPSAVVGLSIAPMLRSLVLILGTFSAKYRVNPVERTQVLIGQAVDRVVEDIERYKKNHNATSQDLERVLADPQSTKRNIFNELFSVLGIATLLVSALNFLVMIRLNLAGSREVLGLKKLFFRSWKTPEILVWPTIAAGFSLVVEVPYISIAALNFFKIFMAIYAIQGIAILGALFDSWKLKQAVRPLAYFLAVAVLLPMVISLGFFDLWFDFRQKFKKG